MNKVIIFLFSILISLSANADKPIHIIKKYNIVWNNVHAADMVILINMEAVDIKIKTAGIIDTFFEWYSTSSADYHVYDDKFFSEKFISETINKRKDQITSITYNNNSDAIFGKIVREEISPPESKGKRPEVDNDLKNNSYNPLLALLVGRKQIQDALVNNISAFDLDIYNGKYLAKISITKIRHEITKINNKTTKTIALTINYTPISGYNEKELKNIKKYNTDVFVYLDETDLLPLQMNAANWSDKVSIQLKKICNTIEECAL